MKLEEPKPMTKRDMARAQSKARRRVKTLAVQLERQKNIKTNLVFGEVK